MITEMSISTIDEKIQCWKELFNKITQEYGIKPSLSWDLINNQKSLLAIIKLGPYIQECKMEIAHPIIWEMKISQALDKLGRQALRDVK